MDRAVSLYVPLRKTTRLWRIDRKADYGPFNNLGKGTINLTLIRENWPDVIRLAGSLKLGHLKAAGIMRTLQVKDKPTTLARALSEIGRIAKTIHILHYVDDAAFRRRILTQLNHTELRHRLGRRIHHGERGEIRSPLQQGQEEQLGSLGLALNAVVHWNAIYMQEAIRQLRLNGMDIRDDDIAHLSPLIWRHLNFLGRYDFSLPDAVMNGDLRPLRNPTSLPHGIFEGPYATFLFRSAAQAFFAHKMRRPLVFGAPTSLSSSIASREKPVGMDSLPAP